MTALATSKNQEVARPLHVLVPLIKKDWQEAIDASEQATKPYYAAIGEKLCEAKAQTTWADFNSWVERNFDFGKTQAQRYMDTCGTTFTLTRARGDTSLSEAIRQSGGSPRGSERGGASWHGSIRDAGIPEAIERASNIRHLHEESMKRAEERDLQRKLAAQLIDIGYKALASKLHPDKGGSREAMARLNQVRDHLKKFI